jgi:hypothetical protein
MAHAVRLLHDSFRFRADKIFPEVGDSLNRECDNQKGKNGDQ